MTNWRGDLYSDGLHANALHSLNRFKRGLAGPCDGATTIRASIADSDRLGGKRVERFSAFCSFAVNLQRCLVCDLVEFEQLDELDKDDGFLKRKT